MKFPRTLARFSVAAASVAAAMLVCADVAAQTDKETNCSDKIDNDGDGVADCEDADCAADPACAAPAEPSVEPSAAPPAPTSPAETTPAPAAADKETSCNDRIDNDGDSVVDCADADCYEDPVCRPTGTAEATNALCSDFIDNDGDGNIDCDDRHCFGPEVTVCKGSWQRAPQSLGADKLDMPPLSPGMSVEDLVGQGSDKNGERNDVLCSDGIDNDGDGRIDCADFGCRFDPSVSVCVGNPDVRFSVIGQISQSHFFKRAPDSTLPENDTRVTALQLRALGPIRGITGSFFLVSMRAERTPRLTFAMFQIPIADRFYVNINSGGGSLTTGLVTSVSKRPLIDPPYYLYSAFEQGNGAAVDFGGPILTDGSLHFRVYAAGGSGRYNGNIGGRYFKEEDVGNYSYSAGGQIFYNAIGYYSRFDTGLLYTMAPTTLGFSLGAKYDQRPVERYPAANFGAVFRHGIVSLQGEVYGKRELEYKSNQIAFNITGGLLLWPKHLFLAGDFGAYIAGKLSNPPEVMSDAGTDVRKQRDEIQARGALHWFFYRHVGVLTGLFKYRDVESTRDQKVGYKESEARLVASYRF